MNKAVAEFKLNYEQIEIRSTGVSKLKSLDGLFDKIGDLLKDSRTALKIILKELRSK